MKLRWTLQFPSEAEFSDEIGSIGLWVGPRVAGNEAKRTQGQTEDYLLRRLLVAWRKQGGLRFPFTIKASGQAAREPDFLLIQDGANMIGIEMTEAGTEEWQKNMTRSAHESSKKKSLAVAENLRPYTNLGQASREITEAIRRKVKKYENGHYRNSACDLVVYDNTECFESFTESSPPEIDPAGLVDYFRQVHVINENCVFTDVLGSGQGCVDVSRDYEIDFVEWAQHQAELLEGGNYDQLDVPGIAEELRSLGKSDLRSLGSHLRVLLSHLLKWRYQPRRRSRSWKSSIENSRIQITDLLSDSPSLMRQLTLEDSKSRLNKAYAYARRLASEETGIEIATFPEICPFRVEDILNDEYLPENGRSRT